MKKTLLTLRDIKSRSKIKIGILIVLLEVFYLE